MWAVDKLIWDDNGRVYPIGGQSGESFLVYSDKDMLMQSTGLFDVTGVEIFENDIIRLVTFGAIEKVICDPPCFRTATHSLRGYECEVIGNIFENPDLLEVKFV